MDEPRSQTRRMRLDAGRIVILHPDGPADGFPMAASVDDVLQGEHWFLGSIDPVRPGETLIVELPLASDARYATRAVVSTVRPESYALRLEPSWERMQQRAFLRISTHGLQVRVVRLASDADPSSEAGGDLHDLVDVSAGGVRFAAEAGFEADEEVICHFELPGSLCFVLPARIVRSPDPTAATAANATPESGMAPTGKPSVAVEFVGLDETNRSQLLRWVYREQVQRHRESARIEQMARRISERRHDSRS
jgi:hypothetical protein